MRKRVLLVPDGMADEPQALLEALKSNAFYVGALGSRRNQQARKQRLAEHFDMTETELARLHGPVGLRIGSRTPPEMAVSIITMLVGGGVLKVHSRPQTFLDLIKKAYPKFSELPRIPPQSELGPK